MTVSDLLGHPLPADLVQAKSIDQITIAWRKWLACESRSSTNTTASHPNAVGASDVMADNYAELYDQIYECPRQLGT